MGHMRYLVFYLLCGLLASLAHVFTTVTMFGVDSPEAQIPSLGASGAISGVLGAYLLLFPHKRVTVMGGWGQGITGDDYLLIGLGVGYLPANGLEAGLDFEGWFIGEPTVYKLSPNVRYTLWQVPRLKPFAGAFYRWNFIDNYEDQNSYGARLGAFYRGTRGSMLGLAGVWEHYLDCNDNLFDCTTFYPEFTFAMYF